jgi:stage II sporulation protein D
MPRPTPLTAAVTGVLTAVALALGGASVAEGAGAVPSVRVPDHATLKISGRGFGHGHGMSQYGAQGAARQGRSAQQIVAFYYPGTKTGRAGGKVKVLISADTDNNTTVLTSPGLRVVDLGNGSSHPVPTAGAIGKATRWRLSPARAGRTTVAYRTETWHTWRTLAGDGEFLASRPLTLVVGSGNVTYRGILQSRTPLGGPATRRITVNKVSLEAYVQGVIPREMPASWLPAALRAQAIAARTYASFEARSSTDPLVNLCDTSACQVYGGKSAEFSTTNEATAKTAGVIRTFHGAPAFTQFSASNGGWLAKGSQPYLVAKKDPFDPWSGNPYRSWTVNVTAAAVEKAFPGIGNLTNISVTARDGHGVLGGRVLRMKLVGSTGTATPSGDTFRIALGLRSTWFAVAVAG